MASRFLGNGLSASFTVGVVFASVCQLPAQRIQLTPEIQPPVHQDVSEELRGFPVLHRAVTAPTVKRNLTLPNRKSSGVRDAALQNFVGPLVSASVI